MKAATLYGDSSTSTKTTIVKMGDGRLDMGDKGSATASPTQNYGTEMDP